MTLPFPAYPFKVIQVFAPRLTCNDDGSKILLRALHKHRHQNVNAIVTLLKQIIIRGSAWPVTSCISAQGVGISWASLSVNHLTSRQRNPSEAFVFAVATKFRGNYFPVDFPHKKASSKA